MHFLSLIWIHILELFLWFDLIKLLLNVREKVKKWLFGRSLYACELNQRPFFGLFIQIIWCFNRIQLLKSCRIFILSSLTDFSLSIKTITRCSFTLHKILLSHFLLHYETASQLPLRRVSLDCYSASNSFGQTED